MEIDFDLYARQRSPREEHIAKLAARRDDPMWFFVLVGLFWFPLAAGCALLGTDFLRFELEGLAFWTLFALLGAPFFFWAGERRARCRRIFREGLLLTAAVQDDHIYRGQRYGTVVVQHGGLALCALSAIPNGGVQSYAVLFDRSTHRAALIFGSRFRSVHFKPR